MALLAIACPSCAHDGIVAGTDRIVTCSACGYRHHPHEDEGFRIAGWSSDPVEAELASIQAELAAAKPSGGASATRRPAI